MKADIKKQTDGSLKVICKECNKNVDIVILGGSTGSKCSHGIFMMKFGTDKGTLIEIKDIK